MIILEVAFEHDDTICLQFKGAYIANATWYRPLWEQIRKEMGAKHPTSPGHWVKSEGGQHNAVWKLLLSSESLHQPLTPYTAFLAVQRAQKTMNGYPHYLDLRLEAV